MAQGPPCLPVMYSITATITASKKIENNHLRTFLESPTSFMPEARNPKPQLMALQSLNDHWPLVTSADQSESVLHIYEPIRCFLRGFDQSCTLVASDHLIVNRCNIYGKYNFASNRSLNNDAQLCHFDKSY